MTRKQKITKRKVEIEISFVGNGTIVAKSEYAFYGGIVEPNIEKNIYFIVEEEFPDENGILNPITGKGTYKGSLQINVWGNSEGYRELAKYLLALAELDTGTDPGFHEHYEIVSSDDRTRLHIIVRKPMMEG